MATREPADFYAPRTTVQLFPGQTDRPEALEYARAELEVTSGPGAGARVEIGRGGVDIGSDASNDLVLPDHSVSKFHARVVRDDAGFVVEDVRSTNGVLIRGVRVFRALLTHGTAFEVGRSTVRMQLLEGRDRVELAREDFFGALVGRDPSMRELFVLLERAARSDETVLLEGETGTGKELAARAIHAHSARADGPFEVLDCGAVPASLLEREVFGHRRGAFTGAEESQPGVFERAHGGTVFLDEIGELPIDLQPKLLRVIETRTVRRLGDATVRECDVRIVGATNRELRRAMLDGAFRQDLYHRLAVIPLTLPPLRARRGDIPLLAFHFLQRALGGTLSGGNWAQLLMQSLDRLKAREWPGNVRELRNVVRRAVALSDPVVLERGEAPQVLIEISEGIGRGLAGEEPLKEAKARFEDAYLRDMLRRYGGNLKNAAGAAGLHPKSFQRLLRRYQIDRDRP